MDQNAHHIALEAIKKKLLGKKLTYKEVYNLMDEISKNKMSDVLTTYFVASSFKEGFSNDELYYLTKSMVETGKKIHFSGIVADKHSTGGVAGTRTTMIVVPIIAAAGFKIPKLSSRAITSPAGTADCMETLAPVTFTVEKVKDIVDSVGGCVVWNGAMGIAPADDIIIRVEEPLSFESFDKVIVSIMAKKIAVSTNHLVLDIPVGSTMKIRHFADAEKVGKKFEMIAKKFNIKLSIDINQTSEPAARGIGPILEARDVLYVLEQDVSRPMQLESKALRLAGRLLNLCFSDTDKQKSGEEEAKKILKDGTALKKFKEIIKAQGGNSHIHSSKIKLATFKEHIKSQKKGKVTQVNNYNINSLAKILGAPHDKRAGIYLLKRIDEVVDKNEDVAIFYSSDKYRLKEALVTYINLGIYTLEQ